MPTHNHQISRPSPFGADHIRGYVTNRDSSLKACASREISSYRSHILGRARRSTTHLSEIGWGRFTPLRRHDLSAEDLDVKPTDLFLGRGDSRGMEDARRMERKGFRSSWPERLTILGRSDAPSPGLHRDHGIVPFSCPPMKNFLLVLFARNKFRPHTSAGTLPWLPYKYPITAISLAPDSARTRPRTQRTLARMVLACAGLLSELSLPLVDLEALRGRKDMAEGGEERERAVSYEVLRGVDGVDVRIPDAIRPGPATRCLQWGQMRTQWTASPSVALTRPSAWRPRSGRGVRSAPRPRRPDGWSCSTCSSLPLRHLHWSTLSLSLSCIFPGRDGVRLHGPSLGNRTLNCGSASRFPPGSSSTTTGDVDVLQPLGL